MFKNGFSTILIVVIVLVVIAIGVLAWQYWPEEVEQEPIVGQDQVEIDQSVVEDELISNEVIDETANWQIYRNEEYGFEVKYPKNYLISENTKQTENRLSFISFTNEKYNPLDGPVPPHIKILVLKDVSDQDINEWLLENSTEAEFATEEQEQSGKRYFNLEKMNIRSSKIGQYNGLEADIMGGYPCSFGIALLKDRNFIFELSFMCKSNQEEANNFNQMLSTFRFID